jgi:hypothetical protein
MTTMSEIMGCASATNKRPKNDFYRTPDWAVDWLLKVEGDRVPRKLWEPCAGDGRIQRALVAHGRQVIATDLVPRKGIEKLDFLKAHRRLANGIVTNPPFRHAEAFIRKAHELRINYVALLLKADFLNSKRRAKLVREIGYPRWVYALAKRPDFLDQNKPTMNCSWFVWDGYGGRSAAFICIDGE